MYLCWTLDENKRILDPRILDPRMTQLPVQKSHVDISVSRRTFDGEIVNGKCSETHVSTIDFQIYLISTLDLSTIQGFCTIFVTANRTAFHLTL